MPMTFFHEWLLLVSIFSVALMAPGPDFIMAVRNSVLHGRLAGVFTAIGFGVGVLFHVSYCLLGLSALIAGSVTLFTILKFIGAGYLFYVGIKALRSKGMKPLTIEEKAAPAKSNFMAFRDGLITNAINPKAILFFFALFTQILQPNQSLAHMAAYGLTCAIMTALWFSIVALFLTQAKVRGTFLKFSGAIDKVCGTLFILLGVRLALQKAVSH